MLKMLIENQPIESLENMGYSYSIDWPETIALSPLAVAEAK